MNEAPTREEFLVKLVFTLEIQNLSDDSEINNAVRKITTWINVLKIDDGENMPYPEISEYIYKNNDYNLESLDDLFQVLSKRSDSIKIFWGKFSRHADLAIRQKKYFEQQIEEANQQLAFIQQTVSDSEHEFRDIRKNVYTDFISILGIFSALLFGLFVGFDTFKSVIEGIASDAKLTRVVIMGSLMLIGVISLTFLLLNGIAMLTGKSFKSCCADKHCEHNLYQKYPVFSVGMLSLLGIISISTIVMISNVNGRLYNFPVWIFFIFLIIAVALLFASYAIGLIRFPKHPLKINSDETDEERP
ncbi:hypothetical protein [Enterococcus gallinarum]|uniref:hypothetical protein n=2 Tax=Enterococcus TaxID=1350 RepID=UPI0035CABECA